VNGLWQRVGDAVPPGTRDGEVHVSAAGIGYVIGALIGFAVLVGLLVGGILLVVSSRRSARRAREHEVTPGGGLQAAPGRGRGTGKLVGGIVMIVIGALGLLGQCAGAVVRAGAQ